MVGEKTLTACNGTKNISNSVHFRREKSSPLRTWDPELGLTWIWSSALLGITCAQGSPRLRHHRDISSGMQYILRQILSGENNPQSWIPGISIYYVWPKYELTTKSNHHTLRTHEEEWAEAISDSSQFTKTSHTMRIRHTYKMTKKQESEGGKKRRVDNWEIFRTDSMKRNQGYTPEKKS